MIIFNYLNFLTPLLSRGNILWAVTITAIIGISSSTNMSYGLVLIDVQDNIVLKHDLGIYVTDTVATSAGDTTVDITLVNIGPSTFYDSETLTLVKGADIPVRPNDFYGTILVELENIPATGNGVLHAESGDTIEIRYEGATTVSVVVVDDEQTAFPTGNRQVIDETFHCTGDTDGDFLCDNWEQGNELRITDGVNEYVYDCDGDPNTPWKSNCDPNKKDIFIEIDYMEGHEPDKDAIDLIWQTFKGHGNINIHIQVDDTPAINHDPDIIFPGYDYDWWPEKKGYDQIKGNNFGTDHEKTIYPGEWDEEDPIRILKHQAFRYCLFVHEREGFIGQSGVAELNGNDCLIAMGSFTGQVGSTDQQAGTLMHEIGHMLGLKHGGVNWDNNKPNYFSVMNYARQFADLDPDRVLDYSEEVIGSVHTPIELNEDKTGNNPNTGLYESPIGLQLYEHSWYKVIHSCPDGQMAPLVSETGELVDWNCDGTTVDDLLIETNINDLPTEPDPDNLSKLKGHNDWDSLRFDFFNDSDYADGLHVGNNEGIAGGVTSAEIQNTPKGVPPGLTIGDIQRAQQDYKPQGKPLQPGVPDPGWAYKSVEEEELTVEMVILNRISHLLTLYREIGNIPPEVYEEAFSDFVLVTSTDRTKDLSETKIQFISLSSPSNILSPTPIAIMTTPHPPEKADFKTAVKDAINLTNHHDLKETLKLVGEIDSVFKQSSNDKAFLLASSITKNIISATKLASHCTPTTIHDCTHEPTENPIVDPLKIKTMIDNVETFVAVTTLPDSDGDDIPDRYDECPNNGEYFKKSDCPDSDGDGVLDSVDNCPDIPNPGQEDADGNGIGDACDFGIPLELLIPLIVLIIVIAIAIWRAIN